MENEKIIQRPSWDQYFLKLAMLVAERSTCRRHNVGAIIVKNKHVLSTGYNGAPASTKDCLELGCLRDELKIPSGTQQQVCRAVHAEQNAIIQAAYHGINLEGAAIYCTHTPCIICAKMIVNAGIKKIVSYRSYNDDDFINLFLEAGIKFEKHEKPNAQITELDRVQLYDTKAKNESKPEKDVQPQMTQKAVKKTDSMADIYIYDQYNPEDNAMMQALYSRSPQSVTEHVKKVEQTGSGKFMEKFYVGYGHQSIADCGSTTIFTEQVSTLADKAIQDWPLYSGQETSTRYVDMSKQPIVDPVKTSESKQILDAWMDFYVKSQNKVNQHIKTLYPKKPDEKESVYDKAVIARTFDIMRGFLPAGITTQLSWHTNLRQAWDKLALLRYNPLPETREIAENMITKLREKYPNSFCHEEYEQQEAFRKSSTQKYNFYNPQFASSDFKMSTSIDPEELSKYQDVIDSRPQKTNLPHFLTELGLITYDFILDFGSFRDVQRHRNGVCRMPLLTTNLGFNEWYLSQLPNDVRQEAEQLIADQKIKIANLPTTAENKQYYISLGFNMPCRVTYGLPATIYVIELRSGKPVHPTLRKIAHKMHYALLEKFPNLVLHSDLEKSDWDIRRGLQSITEKK